MSNTKQEKYTEFTTLLFAITSRLSKKADTVLGNSLGINFNTYKVLQIIQAAEYNQNDIAQVLNISSAALSKIVKSLRSKKLVSQQKKINNSIFLQISERGKQLLSEANTLLTREFPHDLAEIFSEQELDILVERLYSMVDHLD